MQENGINDETNIARSRIKLQFKLNLIIEFTDSGDITEIIQVHIDWGGKSRTPMLNFSREILLKIAYMVYIESPHISGKV